MNVWRGKCKSQPLYNILIMKLKYLWVD